MGIEQVTGAAMAAVIVLGYVLIVQAMAAAVVLLAEFIVLRVRALRSQLGIEQTEPMPVEPLGQEPAYRIGGGLMRW